MTDQRIPLFSFIRNASRRCLSIRLALLAVVMLLVWAVVSTLWRHVALPMLAERYLPESFRMLYGAPPPAMQKKESLRKGNINGVPVAIPLSYAYYYPVEYNDQSIWEARKPGDKKPEERTFDDAIGAFGVYVRWPEMLPRNANADLQKKFVQEILVEKSEFSWLKIGIAAYNNPKTKGRDLGWAPVLRGVMESLNKRPQERKLPSPDPRIPVCGISGLKEMVHVHYELRGADPATGLQWAEPVGPGTECFHIWNMSLYWQGDIDGIATDMIECDNGRLPNPKSFQVCDHKFYLPEWHASVSVTYPRAHLSQWREIKARTRQLILGFQAGPDISLSADFQSGSQPNPQPNSREVKR